MSSPAEWIERITRYPSCYLNTERLDVPSDCRNPAVLRVLDEMLCQGLELPPLPECWPDEEMTLLWLQHWMLLPDVARLLGAYQLWPALVRDVATRELTPAQRAFACCALGPRRGFDALPTLALKPRIEAVGLNALLAWQAHVPAALLARLELQFSTEVVACQAQLPAVQPDKGLLLMAVQHARFIAA